MMGQVRVRMAKAKHLSDKSNGEHQALSCSESGRVDGMSVGRATTEQTRGGEIMIEDGREDGWHPLRKPAS